MLIELVGAPGYYDALYAARAAQILGFVEDDFFEALDNAARAWERTEIEAIRDGVLRARSDRVSP